MKTSLIATMMASRAATETTKKFLAERQQSERVEVYKNFTEAELKQAFDRVSNPDDWKAEILATCPGELVMLVTAAIEFYTATTPKVELNTRTMEYIVSSEGYRAGPAGDH